MTENDLIYLDDVLARSKERRRTFFFGECKTTKAEVAEIVLVASFPAMLAEIRRLRAALGE